MVRTRVTENQSEGFQNLPGHTTREFDLRVLVDELGTGRIRVLVSGRDGVVSTFEEGEIEAESAATRADITEAKETLVDEWRAFVDSQPEDETGRPRHGRLRPYAQRVDLTEENDKELLDWLRTLARLGRTLLFGTLLRTGEDPGMVFLRETLAEVLVRENLRVRFVSKTVFLPWPMLCLRPEDLPEPELRLSQTPAIFELFLGFRHRIEHAGGKTPRGDHSAANGPCEPPEPLVSINHDTRAGEDVDAVRRVAELIRGHGHFRERTTFVDLSRALEEPNFDEELMYFWCHGRYKRNGDGPPRFVIRLTDPHDFEALHFASAREPHRDVGRFAPFVLFNACRAGQGAADGERRHLARLMLEHGARGVLGPHVDMPYEFAAEFAHEFLTRFLRGDEEDTAGRIVHLLAREFARQYHNPLGLAYGLHGGMDARIGRIRGEHP